MQTVSFIDKQTWGDGPWQAEPDRVEWHDDLTQLPCLALRNPRSGNWCGYVGLPPEHPWHGKGYDDLDVDAHGGLTFAGPCMPHIGTGGEREPHEVVCHVPRFRESDDVWWLGFDCHHAWDFAPGMAAHLREVASPDHPLTGMFERMECEVYRELPYVRAWCTVIARRAGEVPYRKHRPWKRSRAK